MSYKVQEFKFLSWPIPALCSTPVCQVMRQLHLNFIPATVDSFITNSLLIWSSHAFQTSWKYHMISSFTAKNPWLARVTVLGLREISHEKFWRRLTIEEYERNKLKIERNTGPNPDSNWAVFSLIRMILNVLDTEQRKLQLPRFSLFEIRCLLWSKLACNLKLSCNWCYPISPSI